MKWIWHLVLVIILVMLIAGSRCLVLECLMDNTGSKTILDAGFALGLLGLILPLAGSLGWKIQRWLNLRSLNRWEQLALDLPIGMGILAYGILALGLGGILHPWAIFAWLIVASLWARSEWCILLRNIPRWLMRCPRVWKGLNLEEKFLLIIGGLLLALTLPHTLTPPYSYDSLMYHLTGPRRFLHAGRILLLPDMWQANGPFTIEMLFTVGLAFGSDVFAKLVHLVYGICLILAVFGFGKRLLGRVGGWTAVALMLGIPPFFFWTSHAHIDIAQATYEFLGVCAILIWEERDQNRWLLLAGLLMGWAMGCKYLGLAGVGTAGLWVLWKSRVKGLTHILYRSAIFGLPVIAVTAPWYLKNWLWTGNFVYPFVFGGPGWGDVRLGLLMAYLRSFEVKQRLAEMPVLSFLLTLLYPLIRRRRILDGLAVMTAIRLAIWALGSRQTRFLAPIFPMLSLLAGGVLSSLRTSARLGRPKIQQLTETTLKASTLSIVVINVIFNAYIFRVLSPLRVIIGKESKDAFLRRMVSNYAGLQYVQHHLSPQARVLMMWDGRGYYCDARCVIDTDQSGWTRLVLSASDPLDVASHLQGMNVTHLLFNVKDANLFLEHDPTGYHHQAVRFFHQEFQPICTQEIYRDETIVLFKLTCVESKSGSLS
jgi:hypothetical protein